MIQNWTSSSQCDSAGSGSAAAVALAGSTTIRVMGLKILSEFQHRITSQAARMILVTCEVRWSSVSVGAGDIIKS